MEARCEVINVSRVRNHLRADVSVQTLSSHERLTPRLNPSGLPPSLAATSPPRLLLLLLPHCLLLAGSMKTCLGTVHLLPVHGGMKWHKSLQSAPSLRSPRLRQRGRLWARWAGRDRRGPRGRQQQPRRCHGPWQSGRGPILHLIRKHMQGHETYASPATPRSLTDGQHMEEKGRKRPDDVLWEFPGRCVCRNTSKD